MITLRLLGGHSIERASEAVSGPATQRPRLALLALLAAHRESGISRDKLLSLLWPEADVKRGRHLLAQSVYLLRQTLGIEVILSRGGDALRLNPEVVRVDLWDFLDALRRTDPERAVRVYAGPFLDGFFLSDAPEFERWMEEERDRLARRYAEALEELAERGEARGDFASAVAWWRRLATHDSFSSRVALRLMQALGRSGDPGGAVRHGQIHASLLREELGIEPDAELSECLERLRRAPMRAPGSGEQERRIVAGAPPAPDSVETIPGGVVPEDAPTEPDHAPGSVRPRDPSPAIRRAFGLGQAALASLVLLLMIVGALYAGRRQTGGRAEDASLRSIAVLPLENCTPDPRRSGGPDVEQEYFADGLTDALITELARVPGLRVISRTSVMQYKGECGSRNQRPKSLREIARELGVDAVVEGTLVRDEQRVRVNAQLIRAATDEHLWADGMEYERDLRDVLVLQREIVGAIAGAIRARTAQNPERPDGLHIDPVAYSMYLKGRSLGSGQAALDHFQRALTIDPNFAPAYAGLADVYVHLDDQGGRSAEGAREKAFKAARRAIELDDGLSEAHVSLAHLLMHEEEWEAAGREYERAIELNPSNADARILYAFYLSARERHDEAIREAVRALEVDPLSRRVNEFTGYTFYFARRFEEAAEQWRRLLALDPGRPSPHLLIAVAHLNGGRTAEGLAWARRAVALAENAPAARVALARCLALAGRIEEAREILTDVAREGNSERVDPLVLARAYAQVGDQDAAFDWLEKAFENNHGWLMFLPVEPGYDPLRQDPRFAALLRRLRLGA